MARQDIPKFVVWDYVVFALVLVVSAAIGIYYGCTGGKQKTTKEFLMADRSMSFLPVALSLLASFMSAITLLGTPAEIYVFGTQYWLIWLGYCMVIPSAAHIFLPIFYKLKITSVFEYLEMRFCLGVRIFAAAAYIVQMVLYMAIVLYAPSLALNQVTQLNVWISVFSVGIVCTFYTTLGGMKAVMWTDVFQILMMFAGFIAVIIRGSMDQGGFANIWKINYEGHRIEFGNFDPDPFVRHTVWTLAFGGFFTWVAVYGVNQAQVQRALCCPTLRAGQIAMWINLPGLTALLTICSLAGMVVYAEYKDCDPLRNEDVKAKDQLLPLYVMDRLSVAPGLPGLFTACLFSGALSTISSGLNSLAAVTLKDMIWNVCAKKMSEGRATMVSKILAIVYGIICMLLTFVAQSLGGVLQAALALFGMIGGPILGLFILGMIYPWSNKWGAYAGFASGLIFSFFLGIGANIHKPCVPKPPTSVARCPVDNMTTTMDMLTSYTTTDMMTSYTTMNMTYATTDPPARSYCEPTTGLMKFFAFSYLYYAALAVLVTNIVGLIVSFATGPNNPRDVDRRLLCPFFDTCCCWLPESIRRRLRCNIDKEYPTEDEEVVHEEARGKDKDLHAKPASEAPVYMISKEPPPEYNGTVNYAFDSSSPSMEAANQTPFSHLQNRDKTYSDQTDRYYEEDVTRV